MALVLAGWYLFLRWVWHADMPGLTYEALKCVGLSLFGFVMYRYADRIAQRGHETISHTPFVPPITADTLPAEEILVRGSEEPPVPQSDVLLRAAKGQETPQEELLRVSRE